jgi:predicted metal-dependent hydrolase
MLKTLFRPVPLDKIVLDGVEFTIKHTKRKNMKRMILRVHNKHVITLSTYNVSAKRCKDFILESKEWILDQHIKIKEPFCEGSHFYYLAKAYTVCHHKKPLHMLDQQIYLDPVRAKKQSDDLYKREAKAYIPSRLEIWREKMGLDVQSVRFRCAKSRWGSCNSRGVITFNPYVMKLSHEMIDYIIVHELAHLREMNHSKAFYRLVQEYIPEYKETQKKIKELSQKMITR